MKECIALTTAFGKGSALIALTQESQFSGVRFIETTSSQNLVHVSISVTASLLLMPVLVLVRVLVLVSMLVQHMHYEDHIEIKSAFDDKPQVVPACRC